MKHSQNTVYSTRQHNLVQPLSTNLALGTKLAQNPLNTTCISVVSEEVLAFSVVILIAALTCRQ